MDVNKMIKSLLPPYGAAKGSRRPFIAICVGHSRRGDKGAQSVSKEQEWDYNKKVAQEYKTHLAKHNINSVIISTYDADGYTNAMRDLTKNLNAFNVDFAVELHFNCADSPQAHGYEFLYWRNSKKGSKIASSFQQVFKKSFPNNLNRGTKGLEVGSRGALFCRLPSMPSVILEPFFGSNKEEWETFGGHHGIQLLGETYAEASALACRSLGLYDA